MESLSSSGAGGSGPSINADLTRVLFDLEKATRSDERTHAVVQEKALEWAECTPEAGEILQTAERLGDLNQQIDLAPLRKVAQRALQIPSQRQTLSAHLAGHSAIENIPGFREGWTLSMALRRLDHEHIPEGSFLIVTKGVMGPTLLVKEADTVRLHFLSFDPEHGFFVRADKPEALRESAEESSIVGDGAHSELTVSTDSLSGGGYLEQNAPNERTGAELHLHPVMEAELLPFNLERRTGIDGLLDVAKELKDPQHQFMADDNRWKRLLPDPLAKVEVPQDDDPEFAKLFAVPQIQLKTANIVTVRRGEKLFRLPASHIKAEGLHFEMHQLPNEAARELFWLNCWNNASSSDTLSSTIVKLSTQDCPKRSGIKRPYWPLGAQDHDAMAAKLVSLGAQIEALRERLADAEARHESASGTALEDLESEVADLKGDLLVAEKMQGEAAAELHQKEDEGWFGSFKIDDMAVTLFEEGETHYEVENVGRVEVKLRRFRLEREGQRPRIITQIDFDSWKDFGATSAGETVALLRLLDEQHGASTAAPIVHCRAGVGRTGTFTALAVNRARIRRLVSEAKEDSVIVQEPYEDLLQPVVRLLREQRDQRQVVQQSTQAQQLAVATGVLIEDLYL